MLDYQGFSCYQSAVTGGNKSGNNFIAYGFVTKNVTSCYQSAVTAKALSIKALKGLLPMLPIFYIYLKVLKITRKGIYVEKSVTSVTGGSNAYQ